MIGPILAFLLVGSLIVETIFSVPGIGRLLVQGISQRDYSLIMGTTLLYAFVIAVLNLIVDVLYGVHRSAHHATASRMTTTTVAPFGHERSPRADRRPNQRVYAPPRTSRGLWRDAWRRLLRNKLAMAGLVFIAFMVLVALLADVLPLPDPTFQFPEQLVRHDRARPTCWATTSLGAMCSAA